MSGHITPANKSDTGEFMHLVNNMKMPQGASIFADKGYTSANNRKFLQENELSDGIMAKATRSKKLSDVEMFINRQISKFRYKVERTIGNFKQHYNLRRSRYMGVEKVEAELIAIGLAFNIKKATTFMP